MADPIHPVLVGSIDDAVTNAKAAIASLKKSRPKSPSEQRAKAVELLRLNQVMLDAARQVTEGHVVKRVANGKAARAANGAYVTVAYFNECIEGIAKVVTERLTALEGRATALEAKPSLKYEGVWDRAKVYSVGNFCTHEGSLWHCCDDNINAEPGPSAAWRLAVKRGRDGRDAKGSR